MTETDKPMDLPVQEEKKEEVKKPGAKPGKPSAEPVPEEPKGPYYTTKITWWILTPESTQKLYVKFFSTKVGVYD